LFDPATGTWRPNAKTKIDRTAGEPQSEFFAANIPKIFLQIVAKLLFVQ
jgi:hypothetical protein